MKKLSQSFAPLFVLVGILFTTTIGIATAAPVNYERTLPTTTQWRPIETARHLVFQGDYYARRGKLALALEAYSRSIRVGMLGNPNYADLATQNKIVALLEQLNEQKTHQTIVELIKQGDAHVLTAPVRALECYSLSIRTGLQYDARYTDAQTQEKIVKLVKQLGQKSH